MRNGRRPKGRLFCCGMRLAAVLCLSTLAWAAGPALTTIQDTIYRADGTPAAGTVLIAWPAFTASEGDPVAAGNQSVAIGTGGAFTTQLVPNVGATPAGTYYTVVFQLDDGTVRTEFWAVPATSPATLTQVRTTPGAGSANQAATRQYVDAAVANVGAGNFVAKAGDTMTGPLTLSGEPGRMKLAEDRVTALEKNDIRRSVYDRIVNATIAFAVSAVIAMHDHLWAR
jgi:trimeric autotransporter adhesin